MLKINNLNAKIEDKSILNGFSLEIKPGEVHAITVSYTHLTLPTKA